MHPFHLALPATNLEETREFYINVVGAQEKRSAFNWVDFDFFGHQLSINLVVKTTDRLESTIIDGDPIPARHFGVILPQHEWEVLRDRLTALGQKFIIGPKLRFVGKQEEQGTMFVSDPAGNYIEFKYFAHTDEGLWR